LNQESSAKARKSIKDRKALYDKKNQEMGSSIDELFNNHNRESKSKDYDTSSLALTKKGSTN
jgi:hypothetical protein